MFVFTVYWLYFRQLESSMSSYHIINELNDLGMN
jgi:hypothetical protein